MLSLDLSSRAKPSSSKNVWNVAVVKSTKNAPRVAFLSRKGSLHPEISAEICRIMSDRKLGRICRTVIPQTVRGLAQTNSLVSPVTPHLPGWDKLPSRVTATLKMLRKWSSQGAIPAHLPMLRAQITG